MLHLTPAETRIDRIVQAIRQLIQGRNDATGAVALRAGFTTTVVVANNCSDTAQVFLMPKTANAATEVGNGTAWVSAVQNSQFTITHANNAQVDRTFSWAALGG